MMDAMKVDYTAGKMVGLTVVVTVVLLVATLVGKSVDSSVDWLAVVRVYSKADG